MIDSRKKAIAVAALGGFVLALGVAVAPLAHSQIQATPSYQSVGVSASGSQSTAWFHEPSSRQVVACTTVNAGSASASVNCVAAKLP